VSRVAPIAGVAPTACAAINLVVVTQVLLMLIALALGVVVATGQATGARSSSPAAAADGRRQRVRHPGAPVVPGGDGRARGPARARSR
jgi:hypothetical protein